MGSAKIMFKLNGFLKTRISVMIKINAQNRNGKTTRMNLFLKKVFNVSFLLISNDPLIITKIGTPTWLEWLKNDMI